MDEQKHQSKGVFFYITEDGEVSDKNIHELMLQNEESITEELVKKGVIRRIVLCNKEPEPKPIGE